MAATPFDPAALRLWRLAEDFTGTIRRVHQVLAREAPPWPGEAGVRHEARWDLLGPHQHAVPTAVGCLSGVVRLATARSTLDLGPGEVAVIAPAAWHALGRLRPGSAQWAQGLVFGRSDVLLASHERELSLLVPAEPSAGLLRELVAEPDGGRRRALAAQLAAQCLDERAEPKQAHPAVWSMGRRLWSGLHRPLRADEVLAASGLGARQAHRLFVAAFGAPPKRVIRDQQLALARELLREGASVGAAATASGFADRRSLTRAWRDAHGEPPSSFVETTDPPGIPGDPLEHRAARGVRPRRSR
jgi:AraC-like DNA-binding protein